MSIHSYKCNRIKACCENKLEINFRTNNECNGWFLLDSEKVRRITIPKGRKEVKPGTFRSMARQLDLSVDEFVEVIECTKTKRDYENLLREKVEQQQ